VLIVYYSRCRGRPPGEHRSRGNGVTWGCWWSGNPKTERGRKPDAYGGAPTKAEVEEIVRRHAATRGVPFELKPLSHSYAFDVRDMMRGGPPRSRRPPVEMPPRPAPGTPEWAQWCADADAAWERFRASLKPRPDPFSALGITARATEADVRRAFRRLALVHHPDRGGDAEAFKALNGHYQAALRVVQAGA
jgi:hypothetical protein